MMKHMRRTALTDLIDMFVYLDEELTNDTPLCIYRRKGNDTPIMLGLGVLGMCMGASTGVMYFGVLVCTHGTPPFALQLVGMFFTGLYTIGFMATCVILGVLSLLIVFYAMYLMAVIPMAIGMWVLSILNGTTCHIRRKH